MFQNKNKCSMVLLSLVFATICQAAPVNTAQSTSNADAKTPQLVQCPVSASQPDRFALCATANCWTLDGVAYCKCDVKHEKSISASFNYTEKGQSRNVCDLLLDGINNGFTVSTYATPAQVTTDYDPETEKLGPPLAMYTCTSKPDTPIYGAQCDGGICFNSTSGKNFPGLGHIGDNEIVCSCPPTPDALAGFQITGPWNCKPGDTNENNRCCDRRYHREMCGVTSASATGTPMQVSAPIGAPTLLSTLLDGTKPSTNNCHFDR